MVRDTEIESLASTDEAVKLIEQLRDHLETHQQIERTKNMRRNVVIRIDRRDRRPSYQQAGKTMQGYKDSIIKMTQCCTPIESLVGNLSYETPSTQSPSLSLDVPESNSFLHSFTDSDDFTHMASLSHDSPSDRSGNHERLKALLRLKADILSGGSTDGGFGYTTDGASTEGDFTERDDIDHEGVNDESFSVGSMHSAQRPKCYGRIRLESRDDGGDGDDEMDDESLALETETRDTIEETKNENGDVTNVHRREEYSDSSFFPNDDAAPSRANIIASDSRKSSAFPSTCNSEDTQSSSHWLASASVPAGAPNETHASRNGLSCGEVVVSKSQLESGHESQPSDLEKDEPSASVASTRSPVEAFRIQNDRSNEQDDLQKSNVASGKGRSDELALCSRDADEPSSKPQNEASTDGIDTETVDLETGQGKLLAVANIGKALEQATLDATLRMNTKLKKTMPKLDDINELSATDSLVKGDLVIVSSGSLVSRDSVVSEQNGICVSIDSLSRIPFIRGSYAAAAPLILVDSKWKRILRKLMPDAHARAVAQMRKIDSVESLRVTEMMKWAENNPVVAAFGILSNQCTNVSTPEPEMNAMPTPMASNKIRSVQQFKKTPMPSTPVIKHSIPPLEWNVFLDPLIVSQLGAAISNEGHARTSGEKCKADSVIQHHMSRLIKRMILSNGSTSQLLLEALGIHRASTFAAIVQAVEHLKKPKQNTNVKGKKNDIRFNADQRLAEKVSKSVGAGIFATKWLAILAAALHLGRLQQAKPTSAARQKANDEVLENLLADSSDDLLLNMHPSCSILLCLGFYDRNSTGTCARRNSFGESAKYISGMLGRPLRLVLNLRSRHVPAQVWARVVDYMRQNDILVESVASFNGGELRSIGSFVAAPVKQYRFFHSAGDLQKACHAGHIREGDCVFFNAASLIATDQEPMNALVCGLDEFNDEIVFSEYAYPKSALPPPQRTCKASIEDYKKRFQLNIGCFILEFCISHQTLDSLVAFFNSHSSIYNLGLAYGGINGKVVSGGMDGDGFGRQRFMGTPWDPDAKLLYHMQLLAPWHSQAVQKAFLVGSWGPIGTVNDGLYGTRSKSKW